MFLGAKGIERILVIKTSALFKKSIVAIFVTVFSLEIFLYLHQYWVHYPKQSWRWWHYGYREALMYMKDNESKYDLVLLNNTYEPALIRFLFWWEYPPELFLREFKLDKEVKNILPGFNGFPLTSRYYFGSAKDDPGGVISFVKPGIMYLVSQRDEVGGDWDWEKNPPGGINVLKTVRNPYGEPIFYVVTSE